MDAYDIFKKLTKGLSFKTKTLGKNANVLNNNNIDKSNQIRKDLAIPDNDVSLDEEFKDEEVAEATEHSEDEMNLMNGMVMTESGIKKIKKKRKTKKMTEKKENAIKNDKARRLRSEYGIRVNDQNVVEPIQNFQSLVEEYNVSQALVDNLIQCGYTEPTPVQRQAMPAMLKRRQMIACAPTGSGKTAAFLIPLLHELKSPQRGPRALILCPTRELAKQTYREALRLSNGTNLIVNFVPKITQDKIESKKALFRKTDLLISTPNRLCFLLDHDLKPINLESVKWLVIDEADKLFEGSETSDSDFRPQLEKVLRECWAEASLSLFSATQTPILLDWCRRNMDQLLCITVGQRNAATSLVSQELSYVGSEYGKLVAFRQLVQQGLKPPVLVFVQSKDRAKQLFKELLYDGINVDVIHADRTQLQRDNVVRSFRIGKIWVLICTELMGRGIDFRGVSLVINYDFPPSGISYVHRIGRAGRAGQKGRAVTFFTQDDIPNLKSIVTVMKQSGCKVPEYMLTLKQTRKDRKQLKKTAPKREQISTELPETGAKRKMDDNAPTFRPQTKKAKIDKSKKDSKKSKAVK
ncbi:DExD-box helicase 52 [Arctopsyche grandis]|uniref:DExD-box helicase 52 n=1 Tax=Arctopsyche grandis TaxID=121162 RepID=UPI00406D8C1C